MYSPFSIHPASDCFSYQKHACRERGEKSSGFDNGSKMMINSEEMSTSEMEGEN
jgi:hypothetical protein